jgi:hypothetical protein
MAQSHDPSENTLPVVPLGDRSVTRLIAGYNPIDGYSHATPNLSEHMKEYFTVERVVEFLQHCEELGINTFQFDHSPKVDAALRAVYEEGSSLQYICLHTDSPGNPNEAALEHIVTFNPIALVHHGGVADTRFREGQAGKVHDFVKRAHDLGTMAAVSTHVPENLMKMEEEGWEVDFYMTCFHHLTRTREEMKKEFGSIVVDEPFVEADRDRMAAAIRQVERPCLAFKILAAGRRCDSQETVGQAFEFAFENIKKSDAVIVGMYPRYQDEVKLNVEHTMRHAG